MKLFKCLAALLLASAIGCSRDEVHQADDGFLVANDGKAKVVAVYGYTDEYIAVVEGVKDKARKNAAGKWNGNAYLPVVGDVVQLNAREDDVTYRKYKIAGRVEGK